MKFKSVFVILLIFSSLLFAQNNDNGGNYLAFSEGSNNLAVGFLAGWGNGEGFGIPIVYDRAAFGGMFSFGGEFRMWGAKYWSWVDGYSVYDENGVPVSPWWVDGYSKKFTKFGFSPMFRFMYHPFGMPVLKGQVKVANVLDPYVGLKFGFSVINYDKDDPFNHDNVLRDVDFPAWNAVAGIRWYFREKAALWSEFSIYDFSFGINFKF